MEDDDACYQCVDDGRTGGLVTALHFSIFQLYLHYAGKWLQSENCHYYLSFLFESFWIPEKGSDTRPSLTSDWLYSVFFFVSVNVDASGTFLLFAATVEHTVLVCNLFYRPAVNQDSDITSSHQHFLFFFSPRAFFRGSWSWKIFCELWSLIGSKKGRVCVKPLNGSAKWIQLYWGWFQSCYFGWSAHVKGLLSFKNDWRNETVSNLKALIRIVGVKLVPTHTHTHTHVCTHEERAYGVITIRL